MILLLMRDDKVDDQRAFLHFCISNYIFFFTISASRCLRDGQRFTFNLGSSILVEHLGWTFCTALKLYSYASILGLNPPVGFTAES